MKHNDYTVIGSCKSCHSSVYAPRDWIGRGKDGQVWPMPTYMTCRHPKSKDNIGMGSDIAAKGFRVEG